ncbi:ecm13p [Saccharomyces arboricola H-6]|uniref:Ecm13p n=1 Tax=Saccharomyces arboricola (strain H-6 / AS 2.3317 / CBS 10644) TaxID=1160507 RepID=J8LR72_SACAR|nr:ecm13p [Saccharomyces arboricola H-6]
MISAHSSIEDHYALASKARSKLAKCVSATTRNKDYNLRVLVGHANLLDKITEHVEAHNTAVNALGRDHFGKGHENLCIEHVELSNARKNTSNDSDEIQNTECDDDYCDFYSSDEDPDVDTLSSTDSEDDDDYADYDFEYECSPDERSKIDTYFSSHTARNYQYLTHTNSHSEHADGSSENTPRYNSLPANVQTTREEQEDNEHHPHSQSNDGSATLHDSMPIFRVLSCGKTDNEGDNSASENEGASDIEDGSVPLTRFHSCPITA